MYVCMYRTALALSYGSAIVIDTHCYGLNLHIWSAQ